MKSIAAVAVLLALSTQQAAAHDLPAEGESYADARQKLIANGWRPKTDWLEDDSWRCSAREVICDVYPETEHCWPTGLGQCWAVFTKPNERPLRVVTGNGPSELAEGRVVVGVDGNATDELNVWK